MSEKREYPEREVVLSFRRADEIYRELNACLPGVVPGDVSGRCAECVLLAAGIQEYGFSDWDTVLSKGGPDKQFGKAVAQWGAILDAFYMGPRRKEEIMEHLVEIGWKGAFFGDLTAEQPDFCRRFCAEVVEIENKHGDFTARGSEEEVREAWKNWAQISYLLLEFLAASREAIHRTIDWLWQRLMAMPVHDYPHAHLTAFQYDLRKFRHTFLRNAVAVGPIDPSRGIEFLEAADIDLGAELGQLLVDVGPFNRISGCVTLCEFISTGDETVEWEVSWEQDQPEPSLHDHEFAVFQTWSYDTGEFNDPFARVKGQASWYLDDLSEIGDWAEWLKQQHMTSLMASEKCESYAERVFRIIPAVFLRACPRRLEWTFLKDLDVLIDDLEWAYNQWQAKSIVASEVAPERIEARPYKSSEIPKCPIPADQRTYAMSKKEMGGFFKPNMTALYLLKNSVEIDR